MSSSAENQVEQLHELLKKFEAACRQIILLNNQLIDMQTRYDRAAAAGHRAFRYILRLRLMSVEGVRNCIYEYARNKGEEIEEMQTILIEAGIIDVEYEQADELMDV